MIRVFVYGTLLKGEDNHHWLDGARFLREARTEPAYDLYDFGPYPGMVTGGSTSVTGEVYEIEDTMLAALDQLEGYPELYDRHTVRLEDGEDVLTYVVRPQQVQGLPRLATGSWLARA